MNVRIDNKITDLRKLGKEFTKSIVYKGMAAPAARLRDDMKARAPMETGALKNSIDFKIGTYPGTGTVFAVVGPKRNYTFKKRKPANYAHLVEYGHVAVAPRKGQTIRKKTAQQITRVAAHPFVRPAMLAAKEQAAKQLADGIGPNLNVALQELKRT